MPSGTPYDAHNGRRLHGNLGLESGTASASETEHLGGGYFDGRTSTWPGVFQLGSHHGRRSIDPMLQRPLMQA